MNLSPDTLERIGRLVDGYNGRAFDPVANKLGLSKGGNARNVINPDGNFVALGRDAAEVVRAIVGVMLETLGESERLVGELNLAALMVQGGPVSSVNGQTGAVVIDISALSAQVDAQLKLVKDAQTALVNAQAGLLDDAITYSLAFGN